MGEKHLDILNTLRIVAEFKLQQAIPFFLVSHEIGHLVSVKKTNRRRGLLSWNIYSNLSWISQESCICVLVPNFM
jgi:hypothetical protein